MDTQKEKKEYERPVLTVIELVAEEVLGRGCQKPASGHNAGHFGTCTVGTCSRVGLS